jgi:hypothetical protein
MKCSTAPPKQLNGDRLWEIFRHHFNMGKFPGYGTEQWTGSGNTAIFNNIRDSRREDVTVHLVQ